MPSTRPRTRRRAAACACALFTTTILLTLTGAATAAASTITGTAFQDRNGDGVQQLDEAPFEGHQLYLLDAAGGFLATTLTDASGRYAFTGLADGDHTVYYERTTWDGLVKDWAPTTTGSLRPETLVHLSGTAVADFGWRPIRRSADASAPISAYTGPGELTVQSYVDAVTARDVHDAAMRFLVGAEAPSITIKFGWTEGGGTTSTSVSESGGRYSGYAAYVYVPYVSWARDGDRTLAHEYGHAWSQYFAYMVQQDASMSGYLRARGLDGDPRIGSSYGWDTDELIAEDYRQLFGTANARSATQINREIPPAADVPGLQSYLRDAFRTAPAGATEPDPAPEPEPLTVSGLTVNPAPVVRNGTVSFALSDPAAVTVTIVNPKGSVVRTLLSGAATPSGRTDLTWDRKDSSGRKVRSGTYTVQVRASAADGREESEALPFAVG